MYIFVKFISETTLNHNPSLSKSPLYQNPLYIKIHSITKSPLYQNHLYSEIPSVSKSPL